MRAHQNGKRVSDAALDAAFHTEGGIPWLGLKVSDFAAVDRFLVIGASLRQEQPLLASRIRARVKKRRDALGDLISG